MWLVHQHDIPFFHFLPLRLFPFFAIVIVAGSGAGELKQKYVIPFTLHEIRITCARMFSGALCYQHRPQHFLTKCIQTILITLCREKHCHINTCFFFGENIQKIAVARYTMYTVCRPYSIAVCVWLPHNMWNEKKNTVTKSVIEFKHLRAVSNYVHSIKRRFIFQEKNFFCSFNVKTVNHVKNPIKRLLKALIILNFPVYSRFKSPAAIILSFPPHNLRILQIPRILNRNQIEHKWNLSFIWAKYTTYLNQFRFCFQNGIHFDNFRPKFRKCCIKIGSLSTTFRFHFGFSIFFPIYRGRQWYIFMTLFLDKFLSFFVFPLPFPNYAKWLKFLLQTELYTLSSEKFSKSTNDIKIVQSYSLCVYVSVSVQLHK